MRLVSLASGGAPSGHLGRAGFEITICRARSTHMHRYRLLSISVPASECPRVHRCRFCGGPTRLAGTRSGTVIDNQRRRPKAQPRARRGLKLPKYKLGSNDVRVSGDLSHPAFTTVHTPCASAGTLCARCCLANPFYRPSIMQSRVSRCSCNFRCKAEVSSDPTTDACRTSQPLAVSGH